MERLSGQDWSTGTVWSRRTRRIPQWTLIGVRIHRGLCLVMLVLRLVDHNHVISVDGEPGPA